MKTFAALIVLFVPCVYTMDARLDTLGPEINLVGTWKPIPFVVGGQTVERKEILILTETTYELRTPTATLKGKLGVVMDSGIHNVGARGKCLMIGNDGYDCVMSKDFKTLFLLHLQTPMGMKNIDYGSGPDMRFTRDGDVPNEILAQEAKPQLKEAIANPRPAQTQMPAKKLKTKTIELDDGRIIQARSIMAIQINGLEVYNIIPKSGEILTVEVKHVKKITDNEDASVPIETDVALTAFPPSSVAPGFPLTAEDASAEKVGMYPVYVLKDGRKIQAKSAMKSEGKIYLRDPNGKSVTIDVDDVTTVLEPDEKKPSTSASPTISIPIASDSPENAKARIARARALLDEAGRLEKQGMIVDAQANRANAEKIAPGIGVAVQLTVQGYKKLERHDLIGAKADFSSQ